ncbi:hypothetical protein G7067_06930 [Leucobacter insecticola]|uniref:Uncharacterized protein n=1 Tax=Leucobacter insecticola TaxID=2714934 RepID=A0A6G8FIL8_9MICO|nr:hypothetical protein [Leucobacter insecticola]QIM16215.1 hypothetical protein G7067_06930 [Leucobacter insecticola]
MNDERLLKQVIELGVIVTKLRNVRSEVWGFNINTYENAGANQWKGKGRDRFTSRFEDARSTFAQIDGQIGQAIRDCKSKQWSLAFSINPIEHPLLSAQAIGIAGS